MCVGLLYVVMCVHIGECKMLVARTQSNSRHSNAVTPPTLPHPLHQAAYRDNTLGLPSLPSEENLDKVSAHELKTYLASHYSPSRMVLAGVNVDHDSLVRHVREHFAVAANSTAWGGVESLPVDQSVAQYTGGKAMVRCRREN